MTAVDPLRTVVLSLKGTPAARARNRGFGHTADSAIRCGSRVLLLSERAGARPVLRRRRAGPGAIKRRGTIADCESGSSKRSGSGKQQRGDEPGIHDNLRK